MLYYIYKRSLYRQQHRHTNTTRRKERNTLDMKRTGKKTS